MLTTVMPARAYDGQPEEEDEGALVEEIESKSGLDELYGSLDDDTRELLDMSGGDGAAVTDIMPENIFSSFVFSVKKKMQAPVRAFAALFVIAAVLRICMGFENKEVSKTAETVGTLACAGIVIPPLLEVFGAVKTAVDGAMVFLSGCIPVFSALMAASGKIKGGVTFSAAAVIAGSAVPFLLKTLFFPLLSVMTAFFIVSQITDSSLSKAADSIYGFLKWLLVFLVSIFFAVISIQTAVNSSIDAVTEKTVRLVASSAIPVIGGALGDSLAAIKGSVDVVKSGAGAFGILASVMIFMPVAAQTAMWIAACKLGEIVCDLFETKAVAGILKGMSTVFKMLLAIIISVAAVCIVCASAVLFSKG